jgi:hypothetical protein
MISRGCLRFVPSLLLRPFQLSAKLSTYAFSRLFMQFFCYKRRLFGLVIVDRDA